MWCIRATRSYVCNTNTLSSAAASSMARAVDSAACSGVSPRATSTTRSTNWSSAGSDSTNSGRHCSGRMSSTASDPSASPPGGTIAAARAMATAVVRNCRSLSRYWPSAPSMMSRLTACVIGPGQTPAAAMADRSSRRTRSVTPADGSTHSVTSGPRSAPRCPRTRYFCETARRSVSFARRVVRACLLSAIDAPFRLSPPARPGGQPQTARPAGRGRRGQIRCGRCWSATSSRSR